MQSIVAFVRANALHAVALVAVFTGAIVLRIPSLHEPHWYGDEGIFAAIAQNLRSGDTLYSEAWDNKPPLIFYTYAAVQSLFGSGMYALHMTVLVANLATLALVVWLANRIYGRMSSVAAGALFVALTCTPIIEGNLAMTESFMILPTTLAAALFVVGHARPEDEREPWLLAAGLSLGLAMLYKQVAAFDALALLMMIWLTFERPGRGSAVLAAGIAFPLIVCTAYFIAAGAFGDYWYAVAGSLPLYSDLGPETGVFTRALGFAPAVLVSWWLVDRRREGLVVGARHLPPLWLAFGVAGATASSLEFPHYLLQAVPALALTVAAGPSLVPRPPEHRALLAAAALCAVGVVALQFGEAIYQRRQLHPTPYYRNYLEHRYGDRDDETYGLFFDGKADAVADISDVIREDGAGETLFTWSELPWLYAVGGYDNPTPYYTSFLGELVPGAKDDVLTDLARNPPAYIVTSDDIYAPFDGLEEWMGGRYVLIRQQNDWRIFRLGTLDGALPATGDASESF